ncbi:LysR family transcriptional regulator [Jiella endophytica]|uniref:LysR family transcriptional regulator n=1 Tax=Jiella endophytica TaxID=2558362 RepID=A0A4Y8RJ82_9HYPH|nr:LysR family transcriptional regulator [Jiella endophytica]TFF23109.1 LysR family transcriptional regulator [Jiella endophytica]
MRIRQLEFFVAVCETGSITQAAARLNVAQPALGVQLKALEEHVGVTLLTRTRRGAVPTEAGTLFLEEARHILKRLSEVQRRLRETAEHRRRTITLGLTPSLTTVLASRLLHTAMTKLPNVELQIFEEFSHTLLDRLARGRLDLALAYSVPEGEKLRRKALLEEVLFFVCAAGSPFDKPEPLPFAELHGPNFVMPSERDFVRQLVEETMATNRTTLKIPYQVESMQAMKELIARGMACGILPYGTISREVEAGTLAIRPIVAPAITRRLSMVWSADVEMTRDELTLARVIEELLADVCPGHPAFTLMGPAGPEAAVEPAPS